MECINSSVVANLMKLQPKTIPSSLLKENPVRNCEQFDPNEYFSVLTHLAMKPGYVLDYNYNYRSGFGGSPDLFARNVEDDKLVTFSDFIYGERLIVPSDLLIVDDSPNGYFQLVVFYRLYGLFYLYWHTKAFEIRLVTTQEEMEEIILEINGKEHFGKKLTEEQCVGMRTINIHPLVEITNEKATVIYCLFTKWAGLTQYKDSFLRESPHKLIDSSVIAEVKYNCGVIF
jgi:hypothetical protein